MSLPAFRRVAAVNEAFANHTTPAASARADAERLLATARKVLSLYPAWRTAEAGPGRPLPYWRARRLALTRWLASPEDRQAWLSALAARCQAPVVDPDRVPLEQIRTGASPRVASTAEQAWTSRAARLYTREQALRAALTDTAVPTELGRLDAALLAGLWTDRERAAVLADLAARRGASSARDVAMQIFGAHARAGL
jgi:hypothetical protein